MRGGSAVVAALTVTVMLAGCADGGGDADVPVLDLTKESASKRSDPVYTFVLFGLPAMERGAREVDYRVFASGDGLPDDVGTYEARSGESKKVLTIVRTHQPAVYFDVYAEGERLGGTTVSMEDCPGRDADAVVKVKARADYGYEIGGSVEIEYGCSV